MASERRGGLKYMAAAAFFFSIMSLLVRLAGAHLPSSMLVLARAAVALVLSFILVRRLALDPRGNRRGVLLLRGLFGFAALVCFYYSLTHLPLAEASVIQYTNPIFTAVLAAFVLKERMGLAEVVSVLLSLLGVLLVARPKLLFGAGAAHLDPFAASIALLGAVLSACAYVTVRKATATEHSMVVVLWFPLIATPLSIPLAVKQWVMPTATGWLLMLGVGVFTQVAQMFMTEGLRREPAGRATAASYLQVAFAAAWGVVVLREVPDWRTIAGAVLIGLSVLGLAVWKRTPQTA